jgi:hypothetical protein
MSFTEWEAGIAAGLDMYKWETNEYPRWFKIKTIAWYRLSRLVDTHTKDAVNRASSRKK